MCVCGMTVKMPSRNDTLRWLGDDVTSLSAKAADVSKLDVSHDSLASPAITAGRAQQDMVTHPEAVFSDSFSPASKRDDALLSDSERPIAADVDSVTAAVGKLRVETDTADDDVNKPCISLSTAVADAVALAAAAELAEDNAVAGAVGGHSNDSLYNLLAQFADDTVSQWLIPVSE